MRTTLLVALLLGACESGSGQGPNVVDASVDTGPADAPFQCAAAAHTTRRSPATCLALEPSALQGTTPFGDLDVQLDYFGAGDCITISSATIAWRGACGETARLQFSYPVETGTDGARAVTHGFDTDARFEFEPPGWAPRDVVTMIHVDVVRWHEGQGIHDIDITVTVLDPGFSVAPLQVRGTFCDWPYYLC
jgi:hypothetical protein